MAQKNSVNPKIRKFTFGIDELQTVQMYPLSVANQKLVLQSIVDAYFELVGDSSKPEELKNVRYVDLAQKVKDVIFDNVDDIAKMVFRDFDSDITTEIDNDQLVQFVENVWEQNFENSLKNGMSLFNRIKSALPKKRPSNSSASTTQDTD